jgi:hypothetical protein
MDDKKVTLDGQEVTVDVVREKIQEVNPENNGKKIVEIAPGVFKTLQRLQE